MGGTQEAAGPAGSRQHPQVVKALGGLALIVALQHDAQKVTSRKGRFSCRPQVLSGGHGKLAIAAVCAPVRRTRSAGERSIWSPRTPALTDMMSHSSAVSSR